MEGPSDFASGFLPRLASTANHFARESHIDEIAAKIGIDPSELSAEQSEERTVSASGLLAATDNFEWSKQKASASRVLVWRAASIRAATSPVAWRSREPEPAGESGTGGSGLGLRGGCESESFA